MEVILIQGEEKTGKTTFCKKIVECLKKYNFIILEENYTNSSNDFLGIYEHEDCKTIIIVNSGSDDKEIIQLFEKFYNKHASEKKCAILITAIRPKDSNSNLNKWVKDIYKNDFNGEEYIIDLDTEKMENEDLDFCEFIDKILKGKGVEILEKIKIKLKCKVEIDCNSIIKKC